MKEGLKLLENDFPEALGRAIALIVQNSNLNENVILAMFIQSKEYDILKACYIDLADNNFYSLIEIFCEENQISLIKKEEHLDSFLKYKIFAFLSYCTEQDVYEKSAIRLFSKYDVLSYLEMCYVWLKDADSASLAKNIDIYIQAKEASKAP